MFNIAVENVLLFREEEEALNANWHLSVRSHQAAPSTVTTKDVHKPATLKAISEGPSALAFLFPTNYLFKIHQNI